jgi:glutathione S-transferase
VRVHGGGRLAPAPGVSAHESYLEWLHYAEGSAMLPVMLKLYTSRLGEAAAPLMPRIHDEIELHFGYMDHHLQNRDYFVGDGLTAADVHLTFPIQAARLLYGLEDFPRLAAFLDRVQARPAYQRAIERGGAYAFG